MNKVTLSDLVKALLVLAVTGGVVASGIGIVICLAGDSLMAVFQALNALDAAIVVALITGCISIVSVVIGAIANNRISYIQKREEYLRSHREMAYQQLISIFIKTQKKTKLKDKYSQEEMLADIFDFTESLMLWGSSKAIRMWAAWRTSVSNSPSPQEVLLSQEKIIIQLRRDMGQKGSLHDGDILKLFINDVDKSILNK